jgi:hypothetical protein
MEHSQYPTNRADAKAIGAKYYFTGEPCKHPLDSCVECLKVDPLGLCSLRQANREVIAAA